MKNQLRLPLTLKMLPLGLALWSGTTMRAPAAEETKLIKPKFTGYQSCASSSCHGGGALHNESIFYDKNDVHRSARGILAKGSAIRMAESLGLPIEKGQPINAAQCNVCHAPMHALAPDRFIKGVKPDPGVGCESCHGPAEPWLRFHTRRDVSYEQIVAAGLRDLNTPYARANACVACHTNLDESVRNAGHPELFLELDRMTLAQPPHYKDKTAALGPRSWFTGQATALREISWKLAGKRDEQMVGRWKALVWLLRKTESGKAELPAGEDFAATQAAADRVARTASKEVWAKKQITTALRDFVAVHAEFKDEKTDKTELRRRAEVLSPAITRMWYALKNDGVAEPAGLEAAMVAANKLSREQDTFNPAAYADQLVEIQKAVELLPKP